MSERTLCLNFSQGLIWKNIFCNKYCSNLSLNKVFSKSHPRSLQCLLSVHNFIPLITCNQSPNRICLNVSFVPLLIHMGLMWKFIAHFNRVCPNLSLSLKTLSRKFEIGPQNVCKQEITVFLFQSQIMKCFMYRLLFVGCTLC